MLGWSLRQAVRRLGSQVAVFDRGPALLHREGADEAVALKPPFCDGGAGLIQNRW